MIRGRARTKRSRCTRNPRIGTTRRTGRGCPRTIPRLPNVSKQSNHFPTRVCWVITRVSTRVSLLIPSSPSSPPSLTPIQSAFLPTPEPARCVKAFPYPCPAWPSFLLFFLPRLFLVFPSRGLLSPLGEGLLGVVRELRRPTTPECSFTASCITISVCLRLSLSLSLFSLVYLLFSLALL
jgi:hypothetical protein